MINKKTILLLAFGCSLVATKSHADAYNDRLVRLTQHIANEYDAQAAFRDPENMTSAGLQAINFVIVENDISKNSPLGRKNKYITQQAQTLQKDIIALLKAIQEAELLKNNKLSRQMVLNKLWDIETSLFKIVKDGIPEIKKKQLLPLSSVQKDLIELLTLVASKSLRMTQQVIRNVEAL